MSISKQKKALTLPSNITFSSAFIAPIDDLVKDLFVNIYHDYLKRFKFKPTKDSVHIGVCGVEHKNIGESTSLGFTAVTRDRLLVQVYDPCQDDEPAEHFYITYMFVLVLCHEFVHCMQHLTANHPRAHAELPFNNKDSEEVYFFRPDEIEARILEGFYTTKFGKALRTLDVEEKKEEDGTVL